MKKHIMLDLETMGTRPDAAIIAIGAASFDGTGECEHGFYTTVSLASSMEYGGTVDADTICWWMRQNDQARRQFEEVGMRLPDALTEFADWLLKVAEGDETTRANFEIWGNGADFDNVILTSAYRNVGLQLPWGTYKNRCYRTVKSANRHIAMERTGLHHNALDDATSQARHLGRIWAAVKQGGAAWTAVSENLHPRNTDVLIAFRDVKLPSTGQYTGDTMDPDGWCYPSENDSLESGPVTHWMPLPQHPSRGG